ncbi:McrC family protein [Daejeonella sp.]|uniref:McrC family protein n=1 Tax=Daejeonella sp. TaxID=2805397 RepID=UPI0027312D40|nr:hypothetical protein [Daejeonella sp.]MDP2415744.1 hypothetical protein [Daejeonella sp.]
MKSTPYLITVFEHESLRTDQGGKRLSDIDLKILQKFYGEKGVPYYSLIHNGVKFCEYVGVIQIGGKVIEVLPKADKHNDKNSWRKILIGMLQTVGVFDIHAPTTSNLNLKSNSILELYFELFIKELEYLIHSGLVKKYRKTEGNLTTLKGNIQFSKHLNLNLIHKERFFTRYTTYDHEHNIHSILYKGIKLLCKINTSEKLKSRLSSLMLNFPEMPNIAITEKSFENIVFDRKTEHYKRSLDIARIILLNYHPDVSRGENNILALMFDMNALWEQFVHLSLRRHKAKENTITAQSIKYFWKPSMGRHSKMKPDIVINKDKPDCAVLDTKWKNLNGKNPAPEDLRQMFVYLKYFNANKVALIYPGNEDGNRSGTFYDEKNGSIGKQECSIISVKVNRDIKQWQKELTNQINNWCNFHFDE